MDLLVLIIAAAVVALFTYRCWSRARQIAGADESPREALARWERERRDYRARAEEAARGYEPQKKVGETNA